MNPETHTPLRTNKQTNNFDMRLYPRALRCLALDYLIGCASDWLNNSFDTNLKRIQPALPFSEIKHAFRFIKPKAKYPLPQQKK